MTDTLSTEPQAASNEGPDLRILLIHHHHHDGQSKINTMDEDTTSLDISTTTAAVAAVKEAQLRDAAHQGKHQPPRLDRSGLIMQNVSAQHPPSPSTPALDTNQQLSPTAGPEGGMEDNDAEMSPAGELGNPAQICLCQQPARIPRPRNAFILFRQHNHAQVVQQNPGKPNPEISKIIGEMWRESSKETKLIWQKHADEEKRQHLQRFPEYRYQPRRNGKKAANLASLGLPGSPSLVESAICSTCGGRTGALATPSTPATPMSAASKGSRQNYMPTPKTPAFASTPAPSRRKRTEEDSRVGVEALLSLGLPEHEDVPSARPSQSIKKRRLNGLSPTITGLNEPITDALQTPRTAQHSVVFNQDPNIDPFLKQSSIPGSSFRGSESPPPAVSSDFDRTAPFCPSSVDDFVKNVPAIDKLRALTKICKPLPTMEGSPCLSPRGAIVAIEGEDVNAVKALCDALADTLQPEVVEILNVGDEIDNCIGDGKKTQEAAGHFAELMGSMQELQRGGSDSMSSLGENSMDDDGTRAAKYLQAVAQWRLRSSRMKRIVMSQYPPANENDAISPNLASQQTKPLPLLKLPIILLNRYILSRIDSAARKLTNTDGLTPLQHWQWIASVWRGCVGPDMTIFVKTETETAGTDTVEVKEGGKLLIVRKDSKKEWDGGRVRRLGFEVNECVRTLQGIS